MLKQLLCCLVFFLHFFAYAIDLEDSIQPFIIETKKIEIPGHPHAFNPSIIRYYGRILMSFREVSGICPQPQVGSFAYCHVGLVWLDEEMEITGPIQMIFENYPMQDPRLIMIGEQLYIIYADSPKSPNDPSRMCVSRLDFDGNTFTQVAPYAMTKFDGESPQRPEKNWVPIDYHGVLLFAYSLNPHKILMPLWIDGVCKTHVITYQKIDWKWGQMRGGTPAVEFEDGKYLAFFHSSKTMESDHSQGATIPHYFMGAYIFDVNNNFSITHMSFEPIVGPGFYHGSTYDPYWHPVQVIFPCGLIMDHDHIWVSYGRQDHELWVVKMDRRQLLASLKPINN